MNQAALIIGIISVVVLLLAIFGLRLYLRIKRSFTVFPVTINYVRRDQSPQTPFLYVELELKNISGNSIFVSEVQQLHIKGPIEIFVLQDVQGRAKRSWFDIREHFFKKVEIKDGCSFYRYYRMDLQPSIMNTRLYLRYRIVTTSHLPVASNAMWVVPSMLEQMTFKPRK